MERGSGQRAKASGENCNFNVFLTFSENCEKWGGHLLNGVYNQYPLAGCRVSTDVMPRL